MADLGMRVLGESGVIPGNALRDVTACPKSSKLGRRSMLRDNGRLALATSSNGGLS